MNLVIGNNSWEVATLSGNFPIKFFKKTGKDIFRAEMNVADNPMEYYDTMLNLAFFLSGEDDFDVFCDKFTPMDLIDSYADIQNIYMAQTKTTVDSKLEKK